MCSNDPIVLWQWSFSRHVRQECETIEFVELSNKLANFQFLDKADSWQCKVDSVGCFFVQSMMKLVDELINIDNRSCVCVVS